MNWFFPTYWIIGCLVVGHALHNIVMQCPNKPLPSSTDIAAMIVGWGAAVYPAFKGVMPNIEIKCE